MPGYELPVSNEKATMSTVTRTAHEERIFKIKGCAITFAILMFFIITILHSEIEDIAKFGCCALCVVVSYHFCRVDRYIC